MENSTIGKDPMEKVAKALYDVLIEGKALPPMKVGWRMKKGTFKGSIPYVEVEKRTQEEWITIRGVVQNPAPYKKWSFLLADSKKVVHIYKDVRTLIQGEKRPYWTMKKDWRLVVDGTVYDDTTSKSLRNST
jgi:hypothetical protein